MTDTTPPRLIRTLSEHHWIAGDIMMSQKKSKFICVGHHCDGFEYRLVRENTKTRQALQETLKNGNVIDSVPITLPISSRCYGYTKDGYRCKRKVYEIYCPQHLPTFNY